LSSRLTKAEHEQTFFFPFFGEKIQQFELIDNLWASHPKSSLAVENTTGLALAH